MTDQSQGNEHKKSDKLLALQSRVRQTPLLKRLDCARAMIGKMCSEGRPPQMTIPVQSDDEDFFISTTIEDAIGLIQELTQAGLRVPIPMILYCPACRAQHVDKPEPENGWTNPPHKSHLCHSCKTIFRPADIPTVGVELIQTRGERDTWPSTERPSILDQEWLTQPEPVRGIQRR